MTDWVATQRTLLERSLPGSEDRLRALFHRGIVITTHYSGTGSAEMAVKGIERAVAHDVRASTPGGAGYRGVTFHSACDIDARCQYVLQNHRPEHRAAHCFGDLCSFPPLDLMVRLRTALKRYQQKLRVKLARRKKRVAATKKPLHRSVSAEWVGEAMAILSEWQPTRTERQRCLVHRTDCPSWPPSDAGCLHVEVSGVNCQPWSRAGKQLGWLDDRSLPCLILLRKILVCEPGGVCLECTPGFNDDTVETIL